ncbi:MAG: SgcJ/EcaC family oxidoreductase [Parachlamydiaceae bacterium]|nr:SgcJ/EcaC family oxidoreductase [Parachlamydiaceae bacterium]
MHTCFKIFISMLAAAWFSGCGQAKADKETDEKAIRNVVEAYQEAYNEQDAVKLSAQWAAEGAYINPVTGESAAGKEAIEKLFKEKFAQGKKGHLEIAINSIDFSNADEAIENGVMRVSIDDQPSRRMAYRAEYIKEKGKWFINAINEIELLEPSSNFEHLKNLAWLVGKWKDIDDNIEISFDNRWDKSKNFITQNFTMKIYGQNDLEGRQIIGWDPVKNIIRSWVFDSDGEFGEGTWEKVDKSWFATMHYTLSDGRQGTSKNIYTHIDDRKYTFASVEREIDGEILPNMDSVTVEKID